MAEDGPERVGSVSWSPDYESEKPLIVTNVSLTKAIKALRAPEPGTWAWACERLLEGKTVRRGERGFATRIAPGRVECEPGIGPGGNDVIDKGTLIFADESAPYWLEDEDFRATDWEVVDAD